MTRRRLTKGNLKFFGRLTEALCANLADAAKADGLMEEIRADLTSFSNARFTLVRVGERVADESPAPMLIDPDNSLGLVPEGNWMDLICGDLVTRSEGGDGTVSSIAEALSIATSLAMKWGANSIFYRGEHHYGYSLQSRAARYMSDVEKDHDGITARELDELARFQATVKANSGLSSVIGSHGKLPDDESPIWLPLMQHYDESFGTRLIDLTSSIFAGLHFACVAWNGTIDASKDGLLYVFFEPGVHWRRYSEALLAGDPDDPDDEFVPGRVQESFQNWKYPEYAHLYKSALWSPRQLAQDGVFLTQGNLKDPPDMGQYFKLRIPAKAKSEIALELKFAGYTPERILGGLSVANSQ